MKVAIFETDFEDGGTYFGQAIAGEVAGLDLIQEWLQVGTDIAVAFGEGAESRPEIVR